jgi:hypothetical protein
MAALKFDRVKPSLQWSACLMPEDHSLFSLLTLFLASLSMQCDATSPVGPIPFGRLNWPASFVFFFGQINIKWPRDYFRKHILAGRDIDVDNFYPPTTCVKKQIYNLKNIT